MWWLRAFLVLFHFGFGVKVQFIGSISLSEFFLVGYFVYFVIAHSEYWQLREYRVLTWLYAGLLLAQVVAEFMVGNEWRNALKGIAVTIVSFCHVTFLLQVFLKDRKLILWMLLGTILAMLVLPNNNYDEEEASLAMDERATFLKFYVAPLVGNILGVLVLLWKRKITMTYVYMVVGFLFVIFGARSSGIMTLFAGLISWFLMSGRRINTRMLAGYGVIIAIVGYGLYVVYVNEVLAGNITRGNSSQLKTLENPYNPMALLAQGRGEVFVGWVAFMDKPLWGHGSWAKDPGWKYHKLMNKNHGNRGFNLAAVGTNVVPTHSVLIGAGTMNGIFAFVFMAAILIFFLKRGFGLMYSRDPLLILIVSHILNIIWNSIFSPISHFRQSLPLYFAFLFASWILFERRQLRALARARADARAKSLPQTAGAAEAQGREEIVRSLFGTAGASMAAPKTQ